MIKVMAVFRLLPVLAVALLLASCGEAPLYEQNQSVEGASWSASDVKSFEFEVNDTVSLYDLSVNLRHNAAYKYANLYLFIELKFPNGKRAMDTLECVLADASGRWYGNSGLGDIYDCQFGYYSNRQFPLAGTYRAEIVQAMRDEPLTGITDIGFRVARKK
jgi:gliding motility-associated lipoprotein GldH